MPSATRQHHQHRAEARFNVTNDLPRYDLHFAAASGNLGLVEYALKNGQPINSFLNGVLPLHAACAGGSEVVVKYLIDHGADVNAPRLPRRLSNEKHKSSGLAVGASGSTPLHFAAANGHMAVVNLLLACGAAPDKPDKHGVTPEMLARENGWVDCAETLAAWAGGRKGDLPPVQHGEGSSASGTGSLASYNNSFTTLEKSEREGIVEGTGSSGYGNGSCSRRLHVKRSIDNALHKFKAPLTLNHHTSHGQLQLRDRSPPSPPAHQHTFSHLLHHSHSSSSSHPNSHSHLKDLFHHNHSHSTTQLPSSSVKNVATIALEGGGGGPSIPHSLSHTSSSSTEAEGDQSLPQTQTYSIADAASAADAVHQHRRPSLPQILDGSSGPFRKRGSSRTRRPRSAGSGSGDIPEAGESANAGAGLGSALSASGAGANNPQQQLPIATRKLSSKISLRNLFRRATNDAHSANSSESTSLSSSFSSSAPIYKHNLTLAGGSALAINSTIARGSASPTPPASPLSSSFTPSPAPVAIPIQGTWYLPRASEGVNGKPQNPLVPSAVELHHQYSGENLHENFVDSQPQAPSLSSRPSILRGHNRSSSSHSSSGGGTSTPGSGPRTLRFDASPSPSTSGTALPATSNSYGPPQAVGLRGCRSASSLRHGHTYSYDEGEEEEEEDLDYGESLIPESAPPNLMEYREDELNSPVDSTLRYESVLGHQKSTHLTRLEHDHGPIGRARGASFASNGSSSPGATPDSTNTPYTSTDFPFSLDKPPLTPLSTTSETSQHTVPDSGDGSEKEYVNVAMRIAGMRKKVDSKESRLRGESFSSVDTDESSASRPDARSQASSDFTNVTTPSPDVLPRKSSVLGALNTGSKESSPDPCLSGSMSEVELSKDTQHDDLNKDVDLNPLDARNVSDLASAQDLVRRAEQAILVSARTPDSPGGSLSAQLAAYGEILALERRFARGEKQRTQWAQLHESDEEGEKEKGVRGSNRMPQSAKEARLAVTQRRREHSSRQRGVTTGAVDTRKSLGRPRSVKMRRPHTAEGATQSQSSWGVNYANGAVSTSPQNGTATDDFKTPKDSPPPRSHTRSTSTPLHITVTHHDEEFSKDLPRLNFSPPTSASSYGNEDIQEADAAVPCFERPLNTEEERLEIESPNEADSDGDVDLDRTPQLPSITPTTCPAYIANHLSDAPSLTRDLNSRYTFDNVRPTNLNLPRSRTPDPLSPRSEHSSPDDEYPSFPRSVSHGHNRSFGIPLTRVATAPLQDSCSSSLSRSSSGGAGKWGGLKPMSAKKLVKMGIPLDPYSSHSHSLTPLGSSPTPSRSPSRARFGGIKSLVRGLKNKS